MVDAMVGHNNFSDRSLMLKMEELPMDSSSNNWLDFEMNERDFETYVVAAVMDEMKLVAAGVEEEEID